MHGSVCETWRQIYDDLGSNVLVFYQSYNYSELLIAASDYKDILGNQVHPMVQMLFPNKGAVFQGVICPYTQPEVFSWFEEHKDALQHLTWPAQWPDLDIIEPLWSVLESRVRNRFPPPSSLKQLKDVLH